MDLKRLREPGWWTILLIQAIVGVIATAALTWLATVDWMRDAGIIATWLAIIVALTYLMSKRIAVAGGQSELQSQAGSEGRGKSPSPSGPEEGEVDLPEAPSYTAEQVQPVVQAFLDERTRATLWEYMYLHYCYLKPNTVRVLQWLVERQASTLLSLYDSAWMQAIPGAAERSAIIAALQKHHLVLLNGEQIQVNPKGQEFLQWRQGLLAQGG